MRVQDMISTHPEVRGAASDRLPRCIEACYECAQTCVSCADACLAEDMVAELRQCVRFNLDCADICAATGAIASRRTGSNVETMRAVISACETACRACGDECRRHASRHEHCRVCAEACLACADACRAAQADVH